MFPLVKLLSSKEQDEAGGSVDALRCSKPCQLRTHKGSAARPRARCQATWPQGPARAGDLTAGIGCARSADLGTALELTSSPRDLNPRERGESPSSQARSCRSLPLTLPTASANVHLHSRNWQPLELYIQFWQAEYHLPSWERAKLRHFVIQPLENYKIRRTLSNRRALNLLQCTKQHERTNQYIQWIAVHPTDCKMLY